MTITKDDFNCLIELYNRRNSADVIGVSHQEHTALGRALDVLQFNLSVLVYQVEEDEDCVHLTIDGAHIARVRVTSDMGIALLKLRPSPSVTRPERQT